MLVFNSYKLPCQNHGLDSQATFLIEFSFFKENHISQNCCPFIIIGYTLMPPSSGGDNQVNKQVACTYIYSIYIYMLNILSFVIIHFNETLNLYSNNAIIYYME